MYDDAVDGDRFRYHLTILEDCVLIGLSRLLDTDIAYEIDTAKIVAEISQISCCLHDLIRFYSIACRVQTTRCTMM